MGSNISNFNSSPHDEEREWVDNSMCRFQASDQILHREKICMICYIHNLINFYLMSHT